MKRFYAYTRRRQLSISLQFLRVMKLTVVLLTMVCLGASARSFSQSVTFSGKKVPLEKVFSVIQQQTGYSFFYNDADLKASRKVTVSFNDVDLKSALEELLNGQRLGFTIQGKTIFIHELIPAGGTDMEVIQINPIQGIVRDASSGEPLVGVTIKVKGSTQGTTTGPDGQFSIEVPDDAVLQVSYLGYTAKEVVVKGEKELLISLSAASTDLDQLVVVGYGTQKKENLTGAISQVDGSDIALRPSATINGSLQGLMPGLNIQINNGDPTSNPDLNIRGFTSINGGSPLVLVDGIEGSLQDVNPNDIKSVTVLKDAASAAIYGARGAFGVILVTTKSGEKGDIKVNYSNNFAWTTTTTRTDYVSNPYVYAKTIDNAIFGYNGTSYSGYNELDYATIKMVADGEIAPFYEKRAGGKYQFFYNTDWYDYLFRKYQPSQFHNISLSGGTDKLKAYLSGRIFNRATINNIDHNNVDRYNLNANLSFKPVEWMELSTNVKYTEEHNMDFGGYRNGYGGIWSTTTWYDLFPFYPNFINGIPTDVGRSGSGGQGGAAAMEAGQNWRKYSTDELTNTFRVKLTPVKGLELNMDYSNRATNEQRTYRYNPFEYLTTDGLNKETVGINRLGEWRWKDIYKALNVFGSYSYNVNNAHHFKLLLGYNQESFDRDRIAAQTNDLLISDLSNLNLGTEMYNIDGSTLNWAVQGYFGRFNYDYKRKYLLEVNARYDGSSRFPSNSRWGFFPSVSAGWQISNEQFWKPLEQYVSSLKLRASYGELGNQTVPVNTFQELMTVGQSDWLVDGNKLIYAQAPNPLPSVVTWESTKTLDFGADIGFMENHFLASVDWYKRETENMYLPGEPLPGVFGATEPRENFASLKNTGFEVSLTYENSFEVGGAPLKLKATGSVYNYKGVITKYNNPQGLMSTYWEGQHLGQIWGYHVDGQFQSDQEAADYQASFNNPSSSLKKVYNYILNTVQNNDWNKLRAGDLKYVDTNGDGMIDNGQNTLSDHGDIMPIGNAMPQFPFGFNISASYRAVDFSVAGAGVGRQDWSPTGDIFWGPYNRPYNSFIRKDLLKESWTEDYHGKYPQIYRGYAALGANRSMYEANDYYLINVGFLRVKNLTLGYTLPKTLTEKVFIEKARIYFSGENIFTLRFGDLTKYVDPEQAGSAINYSNPADAVGRADLRDYPMGKTYSFGIQLTL